jgi:hypothetical protein
MNSDAKRPKHDQYETLLHHVIRNRKEPLASLLDRMTEDQPVKIKDVRFGRKGTSFNLLWDFRLPSPTGNRGECLETKEEQQSFQKRLRGHLLNVQSRKHLSNALFKELKAVTVAFVNVHYWDKKVAKAMTKVGERRSAGRRSGVEIEKREIRQARAQAQSIQQTITMIRDTAKSQKLDEAALHKQIRENYDRDNMPWIRSLFPALRELQGRPKLTALDWKGVRRLTSEVIQREKYRESGTRYSSTAMSRILLHT